jgi:hypothetical protein
MRIIKTFENFNQKTDWSQVEFSQFGHFVGGISKELGTNLFKTDTGFFVRGWSESQLDELSGLEYKKNRDIVTINGERGLYYSEGGINVLWKIDNNYDRFEVKDNKMYLYKKDGSSEVLDFKEPETLNESYEEIEKEEFLSAKFPLTFLDKNDIKAIEECLPNFTIEIEAQGESNAIIAKNIEETYRIFIEKDEDWNYYVLIFESVAGRNFTIYFLSSFEKNYYKCDQIEGLRELLIDKIKI